MTVLKGPFVSSILTRNKKFIFSLLMEGYRSSKSRRRAEHAASRRAGPVANVSPRKRVTKRKKTLGSTSRKRRTFVNYSVDAAPFSPPRRSFPRGVRRDRSPSPYEVSPRRRGRVGGSPDPDEDPDVVPQAGGILPPVRYDRRERMNHDLYYSTNVFGTNSGTWRVPVPTVVGIARGNNYDQRATHFIRVERLAFKVYVSIPCNAYPALMTFPPVVDVTYPSKQMLFRFAVIYDKQSRGSDPTASYPDVYASGPTYAAEQFRLPANTDRYTVLYDQTYDWECGNNYSLLFEIAGVGEPYLGQQGSRHLEEVFLPVNKLTHYSTDAATAAAINSGNIFVMCCAIGGNRNSFTDYLTVGINCRTTYSDNL